MNKSSLLLLATQPTAMPGSNIAATLVYLEL